jgi:hypothetical protein
METVETIKPKEYTDAIPNPLKGFMPFYNACSSQMNPITNEWFSTWCITLVMRVVNPLVNGKFLKFANTTQDVSGWITLGSFNVK